MVAIIGLSLRVPGAQTIDEFWNNLIEGAEKTSHFSKEELIIAGVSPEDLSNHNYVPVKGIVKHIDMFDAEFFGLTPKEAELMDPQQRLLLECAYEALEQAGYLGHSKCENVGVFVGVGNTEYFNRHILPNKQLQESLGNLQVRLGNNKDYAALNISYRLGLTGKSLTIQSACSTGLVCIHEGVQALLRSECDLVVAGAMSLTFPQIAGYKHIQGGIYSSDGHCRAFDNTSDGIVRGEGGGVVILKRLTEAQEHKDTIYAVIKGTAVSNDGNDKVGFTAPSVSGQVGVVKKALANANLSADDVTYLEAHGTGTLLGDVIELEGINETYGKRKENNPCAIGSVKTNIGHLDSGAGIAGFIKTVLSLRKKVIPASLNFSKLNENVSLNEKKLYINYAITPWNTKALPRRAGVSSFGLGGTNAHMVLEEYVEANDEKNVCSWEAILLSARSADSLDRHTDIIKNYIKKNPQINVSDVAKTLKQAREFYPYRRLVLCKDYTSFAENQDSFATFRWKKKHGRVAYYFAESFTVDISIIKLFYDGYKHCKTIIDAGCDYLINKYEINILQCIRNNTTVDVSDFQNLSPDAYLQVINCLTSLMLLSLLSAWGVKPDLVFGDGVGEIIAACAANVFGLDAALDLILFKYGLNKSVSTINIKKPECKLLLLENQALYTSDLLLSKDYWISQIQDKADFAKEKFILSNNVDLGIVPQLSQVNIQAKKIELTGVRFLNFYQNVSNKNFSYRMAEIQGLMWLYGLELNWVAVDHAKFKRIPLPNSPFERKRHWISAAP